MILSVIIPTRNRARQLSTALESIVRQTLNPEFFEVIVIDNGSTDGTKDVVQRFVQQIRNLRYFYESLPGLHVGRNRGLLEANADILVYADDDIEAFPTWLEGITEAFQNERIVLVGGKNLPKFEVVPPRWLTQMWLNSNNPAGKMLGYLSLIDFRDDVKEINPGYIFGCNFSIRKLVLLEAGGFHPDGFPQEFIRFRGDGETYISYYIQEHGYKALYYPRASVYHVIPKDRMTKAYFYRRAFNQGISDSYTEIRRNGGISSLVTDISQNRFTIRKGLRKLKVLTGRLLRLRKEDIQSITRQYSFARRLEKAYTQGKAYHQEQVTRDPELLQYVLQKNYLPNFCVRLNKEN